MSDIINAYSIKLVNSLILAVVFLGGYLLTKFILGRRIKHRKIRSQYNIRLKYFLFILFMIFFVKIWVDGFIQILQFVGFLSAAITLTQKDNLLNLVGWLIINWRGLFSEEDYIKISNYNGYVKSIGFMYFTLIEANPEFPENHSGKIVKVPNGLVSRNPVINYSHEKFVECSMNFIFKPKSNLASIEQFFSAIKQEMQAYLSLEQKTDLIAQLEPKYYLKLRQEKPAGLEMLLIFYCKYMDKTALQHKISKLIIDFTNHNEELTLAFD